jgi:hypothetical protein
MAIDQTKGGLTFVRFGLGIRATCDRQRLFDPRIGAAWRVAAGGVSALWTLVPGALVKHGTGRYISLGSLCADHAIVTEVLRILKPLGIDAAVNALGARRARHRPQRSNSSWPVAGTLFGSSGHRKYDAVDTETAWSPASWSALERGVAGCAPARAR